MNTPRRHFALELRDCGDADSAPVIIRLRSFLKMALRGYRLRCTRAVELHDDEQSTGPADEAGKIERGGV
jgi:hypothetical protein